MKKYAKFLRESDRIENINYVLPAYNHAIDHALGGKYKDWYIYNHIKALQYVLNKCNVLPNLGDVLELHGILLKHEPLIAGKFRTGCVMVGGHICPNPAAVPYMMDDWVYQVSLNKTDNLELHKKYEHIHPFFDGNGRSGRLFWLWIELYRNAITDKTFLSVHFKGRSFQNKRLKYYEYLQEGLE